ncbi:hypothetical protein M0813_15019 [Anaeramoeba flamelloides]|uniref:Uncharacterized protein n=1 Tax=Anaeramoeba flamelloides TaxID=1746091 RepID=A0ABQ8Z3K8_9EUKA|nr:hypothetical protein M0813_15019 [Anaeramoeba flamelloides]
MNSEDQQKIIPLQEVAKHVSKLNKVVKSLQEKIHNLELRVIGVNENTFKYIKSFFIFAIGSLWVYSGSVTYGALSENILYILSRLKEEFGLNNNQEMTLLKSVENLINNLRREFSCDICIFGLSVINNRSYNTETEINNTSTNRNIDKNTNYKTIINELLNKKKQIEDQLFDLETINDVNQTLKRSIEYKNDNEVKYLSSLKKLKSICPLEDLGTIIVMLFEELFELDNNNTKKDNHENKSDLKKLKKKNFKKIKNLINYLVLVKKDLFMDIFQKYTISLESNYFWYKYHAKLMPYIMSMIKIRLVNFFLIYLTKNRHKIKNNEISFKFEVLKLHQLNFKVITKLSKDKEFASWFKIFSFNTMKTWSLVPMNSVKLIGSICKPSELIEDLLKSNNLEFIKSKDLQKRNKINYVVQILKDNNENINTQLNNLI